MCFYKKTLHAKTEKDKFSITLTLLYFNEFFCVKSKLYKTLLLYLGGKVIL